MRRSSLEELPALPELPAGYDLRPAQARDEEPLAAALSRAFELEWTPERVRNSLTSAADVDAVYVIAHNGVPVATASARLVPDRFPGSGYVHWVGVDPDYRGHRLGWIVSLRVLHRLRELGLRDAHLETDDFRLPAITTYLRLGFLPEPVDPGHPARWEAVRQALGIPRF